MSRRDSALRFFDENKEFMETVVRENIERYRKANARIRLVDGSGQPLSGVRVSVELKNHEFRHGANIFMLDEMESAEKNARYRDAFAEVFNLATIPFYWSDLEPEEGKPRLAKDSPRIYRRPAPDLCVEYCLERGIEPKCHCLNYENFTPTWVKYCDVATHKRKLEKRFRELAERYADVIPSWEVTNETLQYMPERKRHSKFYSEPDHLDWSYRMADRYFPANRLIINDYYLFDEVSWIGDRSPYYMQIERLLRNGITHLDSIGMQFHSFFPREAEASRAEFRYDPVRIYEVLDQYARLGRKLQITEITLPAYSDSPEDEAVQAELLEKLYTVFFSHPEMEAAIYWNLVDGYAAFAPQGDMTVGENRYYGGLMRFDLSEKPAFRALRRLFHETWHTQLTAETDSEGYLTFRGFCGDYELTVTRDGKTTILPYLLSREKCAGETQTVK